jgi:hypothetical protein
MDTLDKAIELLQSYIDKPELVTPETQQKLMDLLVELKDGMSSDMMAEAKDTKQPMPPSPSANYQSGSEAAASNPYAGGNRRYSYSQYRPVK